MEPMTASDHRVTPAMHGDDDDAPAAVGDSFEEIEEETEAEETPPR